MTSKKFYGLFVAGLLGFAAVLIPANMYLDVYGLFRPATGRQIRIFGEERSAKFLHSFRYITENFDGILLGSSVSDNLETRLLSGHRVYNASINGGNVDDIKPIAENVFRRRQMDLAILCIHRYLTRDHGSKTDLMNPRQYWAALGSPQLIGVYLARGVTTSSYDEAGARRYEAEPPVQATHRKIEETIAQIRLGTAQVGDYSIDPVSLQELRLVIELARRNSRHLIIFYPPTPQRVLDVCLREFMTYKNTIQNLTVPTDVLVDFNAPEYRRIREDEANFVDAVHLSKAGASAVVEELNRVLRGIDSERPEASASVR